MSMFPDPTPVNESPDQGHEEVTAELEQDEIEQQEEVEQDEYEKEDQDQDEEELEENEESDPDEGHSEELLAGKYKSVDDLVKGYKNLEKSFHESRNKKSDPPQQPQQNQDVSAQQLMEYFEQDPIAVMNYIAQQATQQAVTPFAERERETSLKSNFAPIAEQYAQQLSQEGGIDAYWEKIGEIADDLGNPKLRSNPSKRVMKMAAEELWGGESKSKVYQAAVQKTRKEMEQARRSKQASVKTGKKPISNKQTEEDFIRESIVNAGRSGGMFG
jgi:hypothetical protein